MAGRYWHTCRRRRYKRRPYQPIGGRRNRFAVNLYGSPMRMPSNVTSAAYQGYRLARTALLNTNVEYKCHDLQVEDTSVGTTAEGYCLNQMIQGDGSSERIGDSIKVKRISLKGLLKSNATAVSDQYIRVIICVDKMNPLPGTTDGSMAGGNYGVLTDADATGMLDTAHTDRFQLLFTRTFILRHPSDTTGIAQYTFQYDKEFNMHTKFRSGSSEAPYINGVWIFYVSDDNTNKPTIVFNSRCRYIDD